MLVKILFIIAIAGHLLCWWCDRLITFTPNGVFSPKDLGDNAKLSRVFDGMPLSRPQLSMLVGVLALAMEFVGDLGLCLWIRDSSMLCAWIMLVAALLFVTFGTAHHVFCGVLEWFYIRMGRTDESRKAVLELFKKTSLTMIPSQDLLPDQHGHLFPGLEPVQGTQRRKSGRSCHVPRTAISNMR